MDKCTYKQKKRNSYTENQLKYAQQHLANERTYLAWIRTAVAIIGIGFLTTNLHFSLGNQEQPLGDVLAIVLGVATGLFGIIMIIVSTTNYLRQKQQIENQEFYPRHSPVLFVSILLIVVALIATLYILFNGGMI